MTPAIHAQAVEYIAHGLSVIPVKADGSKAPLLNGWREYQHRQPTADELRHWFSNGTIAGIGIPGGRASGNLAVLDFEKAAAYERWLRDLPSDTADYLDECPLIRTGGGGTHVYVRLPEPIPGVKLARDKAGKTLVEIRGDNHMVIAPGSPASCHPSGNTYDFVRRGWLDESGPTRPVPFGVWFDWLDRAAALNEYMPPKQQPKPTEPRRGRDPSDTDPGTDFSNRGTWEEAGLFQAGWQWVRQLDGDRGFVRRPGKGAGISGTVGMVSSKANGWPMFYCFTSNGHPFEENTPYDRFGVFARLNHRGDFGAAAKALLAMGYGEARAGKTPKVTIGKPAAPQQVECHIPPDAEQGTPTSEPSTAVAIIAAYLRERYQPDFRIGTALHTATGEVVDMQVGCGVCGSDLIEQLALAADAPRYVGGTVKRSGLPGLFRSWVRIAWGDVLAELPDEDAANLGADSMVATVFQCLVRDALLTEVVLGDIIGKEGVTRTERRSLIDWCQKWAKPGPWRSIRSKKCWCKTTPLPGGEIRLNVAIRHELLAQLHADRRLCEMTPNKFARRAVRYGVGRPGGQGERPHGQWALVLADEFINDLTAGLPDEGEAALAR